MWVPISVTVDDYVDVVRYIIETNWTASNVQIGGEDMTQIINNIYSKPGNYAPTFTNPLNLFVLCYGIGENAERANLFYTFETVLFDIAINIIAQSRAAVIAGRKEVRRCLMAARKLKDFDDTPNSNAAAIKAAYDLIYLTGYIDQAINDQGNFQLIQQCQLRTYVRSIPT